MELSGSNEELLNDNELVVRAGRGHTEAFAELYRRYQWPAVRFARRLCGCWWLADDLVAEAFLHTWSRVRAGAVPPVFRAYLMTAIRNQYVDHLRRQQRLAHSADESWFNGLEILVVEDHASAVVESVVVRAAVGSLSEAHRRVLRLAFVEGRSNGAIASELGINATAAAALKYRAKQALAEACGQARTRTCWRPELDHHRSEFRACGRPVLRYDELGT